MSTTLKWGLITGMVYIVFFLVTYMMGVQQSGSKMLQFGSNTLLLFITFIPIYLGVKEARDNDLGGYLTLGQGFLTGFKIALIAGILSAIFAIIYFNFIDPDFADKLMVGIEEQWEKAGMAEEQKEMARKWTGYFMSPIAFAAFSFLGPVFWGLIKGLVAGALLKKEAPPTALPVS
ncbi:MAG: DUF4199 domain-containing protein [Saprospiraceae bacterium]